MHLPSRRLLLSALPLAAIAATGAAATGAVAAGSPAASAGSPAAAAPAGSPAAAGRSRPGAYVVGSRTNLGVRMADGVVLRVDEHYPVDPASGRPSPGPFPVLLSQTPYGKQVPGVASGYNPDLVRHGYIDVIADVRGTGVSQGRFGFFDPVQGRDGADLVRWAARLPHSNGRVGLLGASYVGINQFMTAARVGPHSPLKAIFPIVAGNDLYRDAFTQGGIPDAEFPPLFAASVGEDNLVNPMLEDSHQLSRALQLSAGHAPAVVAKVAADTMLGVATGGGAAYDGRYWKARAPHRWLRRIVANRVPAYLVGGWYDLFQRGAPLNYAALQNLAAHRPMNAPMRPGAPVTGRYQLWMGPWYHATGEAAVGIDLERLELRWFGRWLEHRPTGITRTRTPLHLAELGTTRYLDAARYPLAGATPTTLYFAPGHTLTRRAPTTAAGSDPLRFTAASTPCDRSTAQWSAGGVERLLASVGLPDPCSSNDAINHTGPGALSYRTAPLPRPMVVAGPMAVTVYARANTRNTAWVATLDDLSPDGRSTPLSSGALLGSLRALDRHRSWSAPDGRPLLPYHPYTRTSAKPVRPGALTRYEIEVFPTVARLAAGDRLSLTLTTSDTPHLMPPLNQLGALAGGSYDVQRDARAASYLEVPLLRGSR